MQECCRWIIHYDIPWSLIRIEQRNGRIDRFGQTHTPEIRYLMVRTRAGELKGDGVIFQRLIDKVEEINRSARSERGQPCSVASAHRIDKGGTLASAAFGLG